VNRDSPQMTAFVENLRELACEAALCDPRRAAAIGDLAAQSDPRTPSLDAATS
jgi:hypothetical protein